MRSFRLSIFGMLVFLGVVSIFTACNYGNNPQIPGPMNLKGQLWVWGTNGYNAQYTGSAQIDPAFSDMEVTGDISGGLLDINVDIPKSDALVDLSDALGELYTYWGGDQKVTIAPKGVKAYLLDVFPIDKNSTNPKGYDQLFREKYDNYSYEDIRYLFVDGDVTVIAGDLVYGIDTYRAYILELKEGWNVLHVNFQYLEPVTYTVEAKDDTAIKWILEQKTGAVSKLYRSRPASLIH